MSKNGDAGAYTSLLELIRSGNFTEGEPLRAEALAQTIGVSRTPVREALSRLAAEGVVEVINGRGARLATLTDSDINEIFDLRALIEPFAAGRSAAHQGNRDVVDELIELNKQMRAMLEHGASVDDTVFGLNSEFHEAVLRSSGSPLLVNTMRTINREPLLSRRSVKSDISLRRIVREHEEIVDAIRSGNVRRAEAAMLLHVEVGRMIYLTGSPAANGEPATEKA